MNNTYHDTKTAYPGTAETIQSESLVDQATRARGRLYDLNTRLSILEDRLFLPTPTTNSGSALSPAPSQQLEGILAELNSALNLTEQTVQHMEFKFSAVK